MQAELDFMQASIDVARAGRDAGMSLVLDNAGPEWAKLAYAALLAYAAGHAQFLTEAVRLNSPEVPAPHDNRACGGVVNRAVRAGVIQRIGYAPAVTGHCRPMPIWQRTTL